MWDVSVPNSNRRWCLLLIALVCAIGMFGVSNCTAAVQDAAPERKPNIVLINLDDCDVDLVSDQNLKHYPNLRNLAETSVRFTNCHVTTPLCGPSRACLFRSQYAHNTGYRTNRAGLDVGSGFTGGTQFFQDSGLSADQLPVWMRNAGYHTQCWLENTFRAKRIMFPFQVGAALLPMEETDILGRSADSISILTGKLMSSQ